MIDISQRYQILAELGRGGMGVVYQARDVVLGRVVALKRLLAKDNRFVIERFLKEAKSIAALNHPHIIQIYDIGEDRDGLFITTEFVEGADLARLIARQGKLPFKVALKIIVPTGEALAYAHERGVIHRDIKPANILLTQAGAPKIADFGLARLESEKELEKTGLIMGSLCYTSPEQFKTAKHVDHRTDIYSMGAMFYEMLTGQSPQFFRADEIPEPFKAVVLKAMQKDREQRYQNMRAMLADLHRVSRNAIDAAGKTTAPISPANETGAAPTTDMILIPAGPFRFGSEARVVQLPAFYIDVYPVTNRQYAQLVPGHVFAPEEAEHPASKVTWVEANAYARKLGKRLPTELEWEKAARGSDGRIYPWGNEFSADRCNAFESGIGAPTSVKAYPEGRSPFGVMDMAGNVWEWTSTFLDERQAARVLKGGAFNGAAKFARCDARFAYPERGLFPAAGFRCARSAE